MTPRHRILWPQLGAAIKMKIALDRQGSGAPPFNPRAAGFDPRAFNRAAAGIRVSAGNYLALCAWLERDPYDFATGIDEAKR